MFRTAENQTAFPDPDRGATMFRSASPVEVKIHTVTRDSDGFLLVTVYHVLNDMEVTYDEKTVHLHGSTHGSYLIEASNSDVALLESDKQVLIEVEEGVITRVLRT